MFCCWLSRDFRELLKRISPFRLSSFSTPFENSQRDALKRNLLYVELVFRLRRYCFIPPTLRSMLILLSFNIISISLGVEDTLFSPSKAKPPLIAPSPIIATICLSLLPSFLAATAIPKAADMEFDACPAVKVSYSLSSGEGKGRRP